MRGRILVLSALLAAASVETLAQDVPPNPSRVRAVVIFGNDPCPKSTAGEIVVCTRRPESERYRLTPDERRAAEMAALRRWEDRVHALDEAADVGIGSCTPVGPGGETGCTLKFIERERRRRPDQ